jgi:16S rRNA (cytidine1402-2'-O)-methyltransferase
MDAAFRSCGVDMNGMLSIVATPIGNLEDISARAVKAMRDADVIACEDTRRTRILLNHHHIPIPADFISYREHQEGRAGAQLMALLKDGKKVALCTDGGFPGISDPGYRLVRAAIEEKIALEVIPGASAVLAALVASGLSTSSFTFRGFPPRKYGALKRFFAEERNVPHTLIIFESPFRVGTTLRAAFEALGDRQAAVCIELTKKFERVSRGFLCDLSAQFADQRIRGEVTIVIAGSNPKFCRRPPAQNDEPEGEDWDVSEGQ